MMEGSNVTAEVWLQGVALPQKQSTFSQCLEIDTFEMNVNKTRFLAEMKGFEHKNTE